MLTKDYSYFVFYIMALGDDDSCAEWLSKKLLFQKYIKQNSVNLTPDAEDLEGWEKLESRDEENMTFAEELCQKKHYGIGTMSSRSSLMIGLRQFILLKGAESLTKPVTSENYAPSSHQSVSGGHCYYYHCHASHKNVNKESTIWSNHTSITLVQ